MDRAHGAGSGCRQAQVRPAALRATPRHPKRHYRRRTRQLRRVARSPGRHGAMAFAGTCRRRAQPRLWLPRFFPAARRTAVCQQRGPATRAVHRRGQSAQWALLDADPVRRSRTDRSVAATRNAPLSAPATDHGTCRLPQYFRAGQPRQIVFRSFHGQWRVQHRHDLHAGRCVAQRDQCRGGAGQRWRVLLGAIAQRHSRRQRAVDEYRKPLHVPPSRCRQPDRVLEICKPDVSRRRQCCQRRADFNRATRSHKLAAQPCWRRINQPISP